MKADASFLQAYREGMEIGLRIEAGRRGQPTDGPWAQAFRAESEKQVYVEKVAKMVADGDAT